nr:uncharacterized protein LOC104096432 [Nicotiana tomentosiformis]
MAPDKQWMQLIHDRLDDAYKLGVEKFLNYAFTRLGEIHTIRCPCVKCGNAYSGTREQRLGEPHSDSELADANDVEDSDGEDEIHGILRDLYPNFDRGNIKTGGDDFVKEEPNPEAKIFYRLLKDFDQPLYQGSKISKLSTVIKLLHIKSIGRWSNESFIMLLKMLKEDLLPDESNLNASYYEAKKIIWDLGLSYMRIDACKNDCMLYRKDDELLEFCKVCGASRWKEDKHGFQPFGNSKTPYSIWPVVLIPYNLPPWLCMKKENFILSMLIPGPESPGDAIDVYLQPLIEELKELWETGVESFDAPARKNSMLHAALLWTINDFPAYANLSGWSTKGKLACPCCNKETFSIRLENGKKQCYMGHRRLLPLDHKWRNDKESFDGTKEQRLPPKILSARRYTWSSC